MTLAIKTSGILAAAAALSAAALLLDQGTPPTASAGQSALPELHAAALHMQAQLGSTYLLSGEQEAYMAVSLTAPEQELRLRPKVDVAVVLDCSGSMEGEKLTQAIRAAIHVITSLDSLDRFSLIVYGTDVEIVTSTRLATETAKSEAVRAIWEIDTDGGTNLSGGLAAGQSQLLDLDDSRGRVRRIVLISDGQANEGIVDRDALAQHTARAAMQGVSTTTVGVGLDFDEQTLSRIAVSGRGNYYFAESADAIGELFKTELKRLGATVATRIRLRLSPRDGVRVREIIGYPQVREGEDFFINIADMHAGETRKVIVALQVNGNTGEKMPVARVSASFVNTEKGAEEAMSQLLVAKLTNKQSVVNSNRDRNATRLIERAQTAQAIDKATTLYESGEAERAQRLIRTHNQAVQTVAAELEDTAFAEEMNATAAQIGASFSKAPPSSTQGKRLRKVGRKKSYDLKY